MMVKKSILFILSFIALFFIWINLPVKYNRFEDIRFGNELIEKVEKYQADSNKLPENGDWVTLRKVGFSAESMETSYPEYARINDSVYELIFVLGFDGPYLLWNSNDKIWKEGFPTIQDFKN